MAAFSTLGKLLLLLFIAFALAPAPADSVELRRYQPDLYIAKAKEITEKDADGNAIAAKPGVWVSDDKYEGKDLSKQVLEEFKGFNSGGSVYLVKAENDGIRVDVLLVSMDRAKKKDQFKTKLFTATLDRKTLIRGEDITRHTDRRHPRYEAPGYRVELPANEGEQECVYFWLEIIPKKGLKDPKTKEVVVRALSAGSKSATRDRIRKIREDHVSGSLTIGGGGGGGEPGGIGGPTWGEVKQLDANTTGWKATSTISRVTVTTKQICIFHTKQASWPTRTYNGTVVMSNPWIIANFGSDRSAEGGAPNWIGATYEWNRVNGVCKTLGVSGSKGDTIADHFGDHVKKAPFTSWKPGKDEHVGVNVTALVRLGVRSVAERADPFYFPWPYDP